MNTLLGSALAVILTFLIGYEVGRQQAHITVATECTKLGSFYVGDRVFKCTEASIKE